MTNKGRLHHKAIGYKDLEKALKLIKNARDSGKMENASFSSQIETQKIKEETKLYRNSWIVEPLDNVVDFLTARSEGKPCKCLTRFEWMCETHHPATINNSIKAKAEP